MLEKEEEEVDTSILLIQTNRLLSAVGILDKKIDSIDELQKVASSMFISIVESLFNFRIDGIERTPKIIADYESNAQLLIDSLSKIIKINLKHIHGKSIAEGDINTISNLIHLLVRIVNMKK
jgi:hypothetical protein